MRAVGYFAPGPITAPDSLVDIEGSLRSRYNALCIASFRFFMLTGGHSAGSQRVICIIKRMVTTGPAFRWCMSRELKCP